MRARLIGSRTWISKMAEFDHESETVHHLNNPYLLVESVSAYFVNYSWHDCSMRRPVFSGEKEIQIFQQYETTSAV